MKKSKDHLNIDLEFLDKKEPLRVTPKPKAHEGKEPNWRFYDPNKANSGKQYNWKNILIVGGIVLFIVWANFSNSNSSSSTSGSYDSSSTNCSNVKPGQYCCSTANNTEADSLQPDPSTKTQLDNQLTKLDNERLYLDNTDQYAIDTYNAEIDQYNRDKNAYNSKIDQYNNFLSQNCTLK